MDTAPFAARPAPTPPAMRVSIDTSQALPASAIVAAATLLQGSGPHTAA